MFFGVIIIFVFFFPLFKGEKFDVVVIGSGISGLSAASYLAQNGKSVALVEQCDNLGGSIQTFTRKGASGLDSSTKDLEEITGEEVDLVPLGRESDVLQLNTSDPEDWYYLHSNVTQFFLWVLETFPEEKSAIETYIKTLKTIRNDSIHLVPFVDSLTTNKRLRYVLTFLDGYSSMIGDFPFKFYNIVLQFNFGNRGATFPSGAGDRIVKGAINQIESNEGKIFSSCSAEHLHLNEDEKVTKLSTSCGDFETSLVISTMGAKNTFSDRFIEKEVLEKYGYLKKAEELKPTPTGMIHYVGFNYSNDVLKLPKATMWYDDLEFETSEFDLFKIRNLYSTTSTRDPSSPKDRTTLVMSNDGVLFDWFLPWEDTMTHHRPKEYYEFKKLFEDSAMKWLYSTFPSTVGKVDLVVSASPLTLRDYLNHPNGTIYASQMNVPEVFEWLTPKTKIEGLFLAGQEIQNFGGVQYSCTSGITTAKLVLEELEEKHEKEFIRETAIN